ncbi:hypothetical protein TNCV_2953691 [Trichonephila clavipes]|nr:hypothetical protein TNCV_2953691 [Trichonephila clavipes]
MFDPSSFANPTPLAHADTSRDVLPRGGIWLMASAECIGGPRSPTTQRYSAGCSEYRQCVLEGCGSEIQHHLKP